MQAGLREFILIFVVGFGSIAVGVALIRLVRRQRTVALRRAARKLEMSFDAQAMGALDAAYNDFHLFERGGDISARNLIFGKLGRGELRMFDFIYYVGSAHGPQRRAATIAALLQRDWRLPRFALRPTEKSAAGAGVIVHIDRLPSANLFPDEGEPDRVQDFDFEAYPDFSSRFTVQGRDEAAVRKLFSSFVIDTLERRDDWCVEGENDWMLIYRERTLTGPRNLRQFLDEVRDVASPFGWK